jgi:drug/metabolite transporter (DMT)-like permease
MTRRAWAGFLLVCLLQGSGLILDQLMPPLLSGLLRFGIHNVLLGALFLLASRGRSAAGGASAASLAMWGTLFFGVPRIVFAGAGGHVDGFTELLVTLLLPVVVVVVTSQRNVSFGVDDNPLRMLLPALLGLGGAVLVLPFYLPTSGVGRVWLGLMVVAAGVAGIAAVRLHGLLQGIGVLRSAAILFGISGAFALACSGVDLNGIPMWNGPAAIYEAVRLLLVEAPMLLLTAWLLREMSPVRYSARPLVVVFVMIAESYLSERPTIPWTTVAGVVLLAAGALGLLRDDSRKVLG